MIEESASAVIERLKVAYGASSDTELCAFAEVNRQTLSNWKARNSVPYTLCVSTAKSRNVSIDWLLTGQGIMQRHAPAASPNPAANTLGALDRREEAVLTLFRALDEGAQREIQQVAEEKKRLREVEQRVMELQIQLAEVKKLA